MNAETILNAARGVLAQRGRCFGQYEHAGEVCVLGAMAIAAGLEPEHWFEVQTTPADSLTDAEKNLIDAARMLARVVVPQADGVVLHDLVVLIGHWHDGERGPGDVRPANSEVMAALSAAAAVASALSLPVNGVVL
ncbi:DUF6197 family protein [Planobispora rosea]|uniref:DUF6197 family protein n=1 Tax=Planobispora rosea TaxID=35762 RepID=UPI00083A9ABF|nr:hypothetical protein [Planobispora rosea]